MQKTRRRAIVAGGSHGFMKDYILKRLLGTVPILFGVTLFTFLMLQMIPGDPATVLAGERATEEQIERLREELGLNDPVHVQFGRYLWNLARLDLGRSLHTDRPVIREIAERLPATVELTLAAMFVAAAIGLVSGTVAAMKLNTPWDWASMILALTGVSIPIFWLGLELIHIFAYQLQWFPTVGRVSGPAPPAVTGLFVADSLLSGDFRALGNALAHLCLPAVTIGLLSSALIARMTRGSLAQVLRQDFMLLVKAKGAKRIRILRHAFAAGFVPILTVMGLQLGALLGGAILTEHVFSWPGLGSFLVQAVFARDFPSIQALVLLSALVFTGANLAVDILSALFDPRIRERFEIQG